MPVPLLTVDAFSDRPFAGNPAAVCWLEEPREAAWMQAVAAEMNLSETAFVGPHAEGFSVRWFTPAVEVPLCGHATLASAHALWATGRAAADRPISFHTRSGRLVADRVGSGDDADAGEWIRLDFPRYANAAETPPPAVVAAIGAEPVASARVTPDAGHDPTWILQLADASAVRAVAPDFGALRAAAAGVSITAEGDEAGVDFVSRFFAPMAGIDEDPVTGAAHCWLAPFWAGRTGKTRFRAVQASARGGRLGVRLAGERVRLEGQAVTIVEGVLHA